MTVPTMYDPARDAFTSDDNALQGEDGSASPGQAARGPAPSEVSTTPNRHGMLG